MQFDKDENLIVCVGGMGVYGVRPGGEVFKVTDETGRTWTKLNDDSRVRMADDLDIAPDGKSISATARRAMKLSNYPLEIVEGRPNGRVLCYDPATGKTRKIIKSFYFPNGVCVAHDGAFGVDRLHNRLPYLSPLACGPAQRHDGDPDRRNYQGIRTTSIAPPTGIIGWR